MRSSKIALWIGIFCVVTLAGLPAVADTLTFDSINTNNSPYYVDITTTNYLSQYGVTLVNNTPGTTVAVLCANANYNSSCSSGTGAIYAPSSANVLTQQGGLYGESYTLYFSNPLTSLSFDLAGANSYNLLALWSATAYNASNGVLTGASGGGGLQSFSVQSYTLAGAGIDHVTFSSNCFGACGEQLAIDDVSSADLHLTKTPEPASILLLATGLAGLASMRRKRLAK